MLQRDIADRLYSIALRRYRKEHPEFVFTNDFAERLWLSIEGKLQHDGEDAARVYVETAELLV
jgi:hypothetical protein